MAVAWICINKDGIIDTVSLVEWTDPATLKEWRSEGREPKLVDFGDKPISVPAPLPEGARILKM